MESSLKKFLEQFLNFKVVGKKVVIPYWKNDLKKSIFGPFGGKGTPEQIKQAVTEAALKVNLNLENLSPNEIHMLMKQNKIGLDCSGFAYQILNFLGKEKYGEGIENKVKGVNGQGITKTNADALANIENTIIVKDLKEVQVGDLLRFSGGRHIAVIVEKTPQNIIYAHISKRTETEGPHLAKIIITNPNLGLEDQEWQEKTKDKFNFGKKNYLPKQGDSIRRLKFWR